MQIKKNFSRAVYHDHESTKFLTVVSRVPTRLKKENGRRSGMYSHPWAPIPHPDGSSCGQRQSLDRLAAFPDSPFSPSATRALPSSVQARAVASWMTVLLRTSRTLLRIRRRLWVWTRPRGDSCSLVPARPQVPDLIPVAKERRRNRRAPDPRAGPVTIARS